jgi:hypothetical protein
MRHFASSILLLAAACAAVAALSPALPYTAPLGYKVVDSNGLVPIKSHNASKRNRRRYHNRLPVIIVDAAGTLYAISADDGYASHIYLLDLKSSSHYQQAPPPPPSPPSSSSSPSPLTQGFDYAVLAGKLAVDAQVLRPTNQTETQFQQSHNPKPDSPQASFFKHVSPTDVALLHRFLDWLWHDHLRLFQQPYFSGQCNSIVIICCCRHHKRRVARCSSEILIPPDCLFAASVS